MTPTNTDYSSTLAGLELDDLRQRALPALNHPRPLELFAESCRSMGLGGNIGLATTIYLAATTRVLGKRKKLQAHTFVLGPASAGKSFETDAALSHLPAESLIRFDGCSPRSLIYSDSDIRHRVILYAEMDALPLGNGDDDSANAALSYLRTLVVNGEASYHVTVKVKEGYSTREYRKEGPATLLVTGTSRIRDEQLASRLHEVELTVDRDRLRSVMQAQGRMLQGGKPHAPSETIVAMQGYLQALAPIEVTIPFADALGRTMLENARVTDPRLTREFPRIAGFTAAHALLCIERRDRDDEGCVVATLEDYEAARGVIRELSTIREFSKFAMEVWDTVATQYKATGNGVTVADVAKTMLKAKAYVRTAMTTLLTGGAVTDARDRPSRTAPLVVIPNGDSPCRMLLPTAEEFALPPQTRCKRNQVLSPEEDSLHMQAPPSHMQVKPMGDDKLGPLASGNGGGNTPDTYLKDGQVYRAGDTLPDGRRVDSIEDGVPVLVRPRPVAPEVRL